jgi:Ca2+-binding EF-hand superfamily protein
VLHCVNLVCQASYSDMKMASPSGLVDSDAVQSMLGRFLPPRVVQRLYCRWDVGSAGVVSCDAMLMTLSICCNGSVDEKAKLAFELFDPELTGVLTPEAVRRLTAETITLSFVRCTVVVGCRWKSWWVPHCGLSCP